MTSRINKTASALAASVAIALSAGWIAGASAQQTPPAGDRTAMHERHSAEHMQAKMKERIAKMASRLEIKASQQAAWGDYVKAREGMMANRPARPARDADAATIARARADHVADMGRKLAVVADATGRLQAVLTPEQRKVFDEMARRGGHRGMRGHGGRGEHGGRGGEHGGRGEGRGGWGGSDQQRAPR